MQISVGSCHISHTTISTYLAPPSFSEAKYFPFKIGSALIAQLPMIGTLLGKIAMRVKRLRSGSFNTKVEDPQPSLKKTAHSRNASCCGSLLD